MLSEISGRDSVAATLLTIKNCDFKGLIPTIVLTGTEYGNLNCFDYNIGYIKTHQNSGKKIYDPIIIYDLKLWNSLNAKYMSEIINKFGFYSPCIGCHLYTHILRVPIAKKLGIKNIITGERINHNGKQKINQLEYVLNTYNKILKIFNVNLYAPLKFYNSDDEIKQIIGEKWSESPAQLECVLSGNYCDKNENITITTNLIEKYCDDFIYPVGKELLDSILFGKSKDYNKIVSDILQKI
ncbi:MAG: hypothetical protein WA130_13270 [Candidatus Methanoperedens sp.]